MGLRGHRDDKVLYAYTAMHTAELPTHFVGIRSEGQTSRQYSANVVLDYFRF